MLIISMITGAVSAIAGYWLAHWLDASIAGSMMAVLGVFFLIVYLFSPLEGRFTKKVRHRNQGQEISLLTLLIHIQSHKELSEKSVRHLQEHINWTAEKAERILKLATRKEYVYVQEGVIHITPQGQTFSGQKVYEYLEK